MFRASLLALGCCFSALAGAADNGIYLGAGATQTDYGFENPTASPNFDDEDRGFKGIVGWRPLDHFGVEMNYVDHGDARIPSNIVCAQLFAPPCPAEILVSGETLSAFAVGYLPLPLVDLYAKAGVNAWDLSARGIPSGTGFNASEDGTDFAWGAGVQARFGSFGARLEYERFEIDAGEELGTISLSFTYTFL